MIFDSDSMDIISVTHNAFVCLKWDTVDYLNRKAADGDISRLQVCFSDLVYFC